MSTETTELNQPNDGGDSSEPRHRFGFRHADTGVDEDRVDRDAGTTDLDDEDVADPQPTFTPSASGPTTTLPDPREPVDVPVVQGKVVPDDATGPDDPNAPLLGDAVGLRASWQQAAAAFVDDPRAAVADAAELVEHMAQTLIGALQQRQRQLRGQWEIGTAAGPNGSDATVGEASGTVDTEELRHLMQSYRALFNQLTNS
jgi:hypothetical protein